MLRKRNSDVLIETLPLAGKRVIDVGCGDGSLSKLMASHGASVKGVECQPRQLAKARAQACDGFKVIDGVAQHLPSEDASTDIVVFFNSLHHVPTADMDRSLAEAARVLRPDGVLYVCEPVAEGSFFDLVRLVDDETEVRAAAYAALCGAAKHGLRAGEEICYVHTVRHADFDSFRDRIVSANPERDQRFSEHEAELRKAFDALATIDPQGNHHYDQPMRVNLLTKEP